MGDATPRLDDGRVSYFVLTDRGLYFPVTRKKRLIGAHHIAVAVDKNDVASAKSGRSPHGFLTVDFYDSVGARLAGITFHPMADPDGLAGEQARRVARGLGIDEIDLGSEPMI